MRDGRRRGSIPLVFEYIFSLVFMALFAGGILYFILSHANGEAFYSKFYAADLGTNAEIVNAGAGDVVLRYDNLKPNLDLGFWFANGRVTAGKNTESKSPPTNAEIETYGLAAYHQSTPYLERPQYLVLRKSGNAFAITEAETALTTCPAVLKPAKEITQATVGIEIVELPVADDRERIITAFRAAAPQLVFADKDPTFLLRLRLRTGSEERIIYAPTTKDGAVIACHAAQQLRALTLIPYASNTPPTTTGVTVIDMTILTSNDRRLSPELLGTALGNALVAYYR